MLTIYWNIRQHIRLFDMDTFTSAANNHELAIRNTIQHTLKELFGFQTIFLASDNSNKNNFHHFTRFLLSRHPSIESISWLPAQRNDWSSNPAKNISQHFIPEPPHSINLPIHTCQEIHFPTHYSIFSHNRDNHMVESHIEKLKEKQRHAICQSVQSREIITLLQPTPYSDNSFTNSQISLFLPIIRQNSEGRDYLLGVVELVVSVQKLVESAIGLKQPKGIHFCLHGQSQLVGKKQTLYCHGSRTKPSHPPFYNVQETTNKNFQEHCNQEI